MGTGWRRAFCNTMPRDKREALNMEKHTNPSPRFTRSEPTTPRLSCKTNTNIIDNGVNNVNLVSPRLQCKTTPKSQTKSPRNFLGSSTPSSPRSPFSILKNTLRLSRNSCGVCMQSMKSGRGMAIYTAECSHAFHFPCIASYVRNQNALICPVCSTTWKDFPLLAVHKQNHNQEPGLKEDEVKMGFDSNTHTKHTPVSSPRYYTKMQQCEFYSDDEPLLTPRAGANKFVPIPEVKETDEEIEEFKGFFTNPVSSNVEAFAMNIDSGNVDVSLLPEAAVISVGRTHDTYAVILKVKAPRHFIMTRRAPIDLVTVLDVGGSMVGAKLEMLKRAVGLVISSLSLADRLSVVVFSATPRRLLPLTRMTAQGQRLARGIIDRLACSQGASMGEALKHATKVLEERRERNPVASIILLSDGQDDTVPSNYQPPFHPTTNKRSRFAHVEIPVHSSGYSREPVEDAFTKCVGELQSVVVQDLRIQLGFASSTDPAEIMAVYSCNGQPTVFGPGCVRLGDLYAEEEREIMVEIRVPKSSFGSLHHVFSVKSCYRDPATQELIYGREQALLVPRPQTVRSGLPKIQRLRNSFISTRAIAESRRLMEHNELSSALPLLSSARNLLIQSRSESAGEFIRGLEAVIAEVLWMRRRMEREMGLFVDENGEPLTPAEKLAKKNSFSRVSDLHGFENSRF